MRFINKDKVMFQMNNLNNIIKNSKFDEIFKVEKITSIVDKEPINIYLQKYGFNICTFWIYFWSVVSIQFKII